MVFDSSKQPYNDKYKFNKRTSKVLFNPNRKLFQSELNESQSALYEQLHLIGDSTLSEGSILSGMGLIPKGEVSNSNKNYFDNADQSYTVQGINSSSQTTGDALPWGLKVNNLSNFTNDLMFSITYLIQGNNPSGNMKVTFNNNFEDEGIVTKDLSQISRTGTLKVKIPKEKLENSSSNRLKINFQNVPTNVSVTFSNPDLEINTGVLGNPNLISYKSLKAIGSSLDTGNYINTGKVDVLNKATVSSDKVGMQFTSVNNSDARLALSFWITRKSGNLYNFALGNVNSGSISKAVVDGKVVQNDLTSIDNALVDINGNKINISDGNSHEVVILFKDMNLGENIFNLYFNQGYTPTTTGNANVTLNYLKVEEGEEATPWRLSSQDQSASGIGIRNQLYTISEGSVYMSGLVRSFKAQDITLSNTGVEKIGISLKETIITSEQDKELVDTTSGSDSQYESGADRLGYEILVTYNDPDSVSIYNLVDGKIVNVSPKMQQLNDILARRTNDESGSYRVSGFDLWSRVKDTDSSKIEVMVDQGTAYVQGYQIDTAGSTPVDIDKATATSKNQDEAILYQSTDDFGTLNNQPVKSVNTVSGLVDVKKEAVSRNSSSTPDKLSSSNIYMIKRVYTLQPNGNIKDVYVPDDGSRGDYRLAKGNQLQWDIYSGSQQPPQGGTYYVDYQYEKVFTPNQDYTIEVTGSEDLATTKVNFINSSGDKPSEGTSVHVNYDSFLARKDMITLDKQGNFVVVKGQEAPLSDVQAPSQQDPLTLRIGYVTVYPNSSKADVVQNAITRIPFEGLQDVVSRLTSVEENQALLSLQQNAMENQDPTTLSGVFSENFSSLDKSDTTNEEFTASYITENEGDDSLFNLTIGNEAQGIIPMVIDEAGTSAKLSGSTTDITIPYSENVAFSQPYATTKMNINPYNIFFIEGAIDLNPQQDIWVEGQDLGNSSYTNTYYSGWYPNRWMYSTTVSTVTDRKDAEFARTRSVSFKATSLEPFADNLVFSIDGYKLNVEPASGYAKGSNVAGSIQANKDGVAEGSIVIPENTIKIGTREVKLQNVNNVANSTYESHGTRYVSSTRSYTTSTYLEPLAQSIVSLNDSYLTGLNLYFANKSQSVGNQTKNDVIVQLRNVSDSGFPSNKILAESVLKFEDINPSSDGNTPTRVNFKYPAFVPANESVAIVLISPSDIYEVWTAKRTQKRADNGVVVSADPYPSGVLFESSNAQTWTPLQDSDLKFDAIEADFNSESVLLYQPVYSSDTYYVDGAGNQLKDTSGNPIPLNFSDVIFNVKQLTPSNTSVDWEIRYITDQQSSDLKIEDISWETLNLGQSFSLQNNVRVFQIRAILHSNNSISPNIMLDTVSVLAELTKDSSSYISKSIDMSSHPFNKIKVNYKANLPQGTQVTPYYSTDKGKTWIGMYNGTVESLSNKWSKYSYSALLHDVSKGDNGKEKNIKFRLDLKTEDIHTRPRVKELTSNMTLETGNETGNNS